MYRTPDGRVSIPERDFSGYQLVAAAQPGASNVSIPERDFSGYQQIWIKVDTHIAKFQSLKGILVDINAFICWSFALSSRFNP